MKGQTCCCDERYLYWREILSAFLSLFHLDRVPAWLWNASVLGNLTSFTRTYVRVRVKLTFVSFFPLFFLERFPQLIHIVCFTGWQCCSEELLLWEVWQELIGVTYYSLPPLECYRTHPPLPAVYYQESRKLKQLEGNLGFHDILIIYCCALSYRMIFCHTLHFFSSKTALSETVCIFFN